VSGEARFGAYAALPQSAIAALSDLRGRGPRSRRPSRRRPARKGSAGPRRCAPAGGHHHPLGRWTVLLLAADGIVKELPRGGNCLHYNARLVAWCDSMIDQKIRVIDPGRLFAALVHELLGKRVLGVGRPITRLPADEAV
jgi:hypothetical protein